MNFCLIFFLIVCFGISKIKSQEIYLNESYPEITFDCSTFNEIPVTAEIGHQILITVESFQITGDKKYYILIKSGTNSDDGLDGVILMSPIRSPRQYLSLQNEVYIKFNDIEDESTREGTDCEIIVQQVGERIETTIPTTTEVPFPTSSINEEDSITVNISGRIPDWFTDEINVIAFQEKVVAMAIEYTTINNIESTEEITIQNVIIESIVQCPINWPRRDDCVQIRFTLPIFQHEDVEEYQLNAENLAMMWERKADNFLKPEFKRYEVPDKSVFMTWLIVICATILLFSVVLYLFKRFSYKLSDVGKRKKLLKDEDEEIVYSKTSRNNSLNPHPKQAVPTMFESETQQYEPGVMRNLR